jgi:glycosyltransferase involved in cell wall biosynthesis
MKICLYGYTIGTKGSGSGQYARDLGKWLEKEGHHVTIATGRWRERSATPDGLKYDFLLSYDSPMGKKVQIDFALRSVLYFRKHRSEFDLIHSLASFPQFIRLASWVKRVTGLPTVHSLLAPCEPMPFFDSLDGLICVSEGIRKRIQTKRAVFIPPFVNLEPFGSAPRYDFGAKTDVTIGTMGAPFIRKGMRHFVEAIPLVLERYPNAHFLLAIDLPGVQLVEETRKEREQIDRFIREHRLEKNVDILGHVEVARFLKSLDLFVYAVQTTMGMIDIPPTLLESLAAGCGTISSRQGAIEELIRDRHNGLLVPEGEHDRPRAYADRIIELLGDGSLLKRIRENGPPSVEKFEINRVGRQMIQFYQYVVENHGKNRKQE